MDVPPVADLVFPENASDGDIKTASIILQNFIDIIEDPAGKDLSAVCDVDELARYYWIQEASMNFDAWERSVYIYYLEQDQKIHFGPVWDMDLALGHTQDIHGLTFNQPEGWNTRRYGWYEKLLENEEFVRAMHDVYDKGGIGKVLLSGIDMFHKRKEELGNDAYLNYTFFGSNNRGLTLDFGESYDEYSDNMIDFYEKRINWIDRQMSAEDASFP